MSGYSKLRLNVQFDFNFYGEVTEESLERLVKRFLDDPQAFLSLDALEHDEELLLDITEREED